MPTSRRPRAATLTSATALVAAAAIALTGCSLLGGVPTSTMAPDPAPQGLERFYGQTLEWTDEGDLLDSTNVVVPLDWEDPDGETVEVAVMRHSATEDAIGSLLINPGGPGGSGYDYVRDYAQYLVTPDVLANYDVIGFDPRGVNHSTPVTCYTDGADRDEYLYGTYTAAYGTQEWIDELTQREADYAAACADNTGPLLAHIDAASVARDMDVIRALLGDDRLNYLGFSYGTYLGTMYAELFPEKVGRLVLDGAVDPEEGDLDGLAIQMAGFDSALRAYVTDCIDTDSSCPFTGTADDAMDQVRALLGTIDTLKLTVDDGRQLDSATAGTGIAYNLYSESAWPDLTTMFVDLYAGDAESTFASADGYNGRNPDGTYADNSSDVYASVTCVEGDLGIDDVSPLESLDKIRGEAPILGDYFAYDDTIILDVLCSNWPTPVAEQPSVFDAEGAAPIIVIGTTNDPATPYANAVSLSKQLSSGVLISYEGEGHTVYAQGVACVDDAVDAYLLDGTVPSSDPMC